jgi:hypothetical protein
LGSYQSRDKERRKGRKEGRKERKKECERRGPQQEINISKEDRRQKKYKQPIQFKQL